MAAWASGTTYPIRAQVTGSDGNSYESLAGGNIGNNPTSTSGFWTRFYLWSGQVTWSAGAWSAGAWNAGAFAPGTWH